MAGTPPSGSPPPPPPNPPLWMPAGAPAPMMHRGSMMPMMTFLFRLLGFVLLFVGALLVVAVAYPGGGCFPTSGGTPACGPGSTYVTGAANGILVGHVLFALGAFFLGAGAGLKIHYSLQAPTSGQKEDYRFVIADRWFNGLVLLVAVWILWQLMTGAPFYAGGI